MCVPCFNVKSPRRGLSRAEISENVSNQTKQGNGLTFAKLSQTTGTQNAYLNDYSDAGSSLTNYIEKGKDRLPIIRTRYSDSTEGFREISDDDHRHRLGIQYSNEDPREQGSISLNTSGNGSDYDDGDYNHKYISSDGPRNRHMPLESRVIVTLTSTYRIPDYARLEYSPLDISESDDINRLKPETSNFQYNSSKSSDDLGAVKRPAILSGFLSPRIKSSVSISSQLSNEYLDQNLTKGLETAQKSSDTQYVTAGLPLGPSYSESTGKETLETGKTSRKIMGALLTHPESKSGGSQSDVGSPKKVTGNNNDPSNIPSVGAALVGLESSVIQSAENEINHILPKDKKKGLLNMLGLVKKTPKAMEASTSGTADSHERPGPSTSRKTTDHSEIGSPTSSQKSKGNIRKVLDLAMGLFKKKNKKKDKDGSKAKDDSDSSDSESEAPPN